MFKDLQQAALAAKRNQAVSPGITRFEKVLFEGRDHLRKYTASKEFNRDQFFLAADKFAEAIKLNKLKPEPYLYLAWLFFIANETSTSLKYLKAAEVLRPNLPGIKELKVKISKLW